MENIQHIEQHIRGHIRDAFQLWTQGLLELCGNCQPTRDRAFQVDEFCFVVAKVLSECEPEINLINTIDIPLEKAPRRIP